MSTQTDKSTDNGQLPLRLTARDIRVRKGGEPIVCITSYTAPMAFLMDECVDLFIVGDSVGMVLYGMDTTLEVTVDMMISHGKAVMRGSSHACVVVDMPFGSYQASPGAAYESCARVMAETGCSAIKLEGGIVMAKTVEFLSRRGVPVMGHVGLQPQSIRTLGRYRAQGRSNDEADSIVADAVAIAEAGAFALVIEGTVEVVARSVTESVSIPTIGIGASIACDGQVLVAEDMLGLFGMHTPKFVKRYASLNDEVVAAVHNYAQDVRARRFPTSEHCYSAKKS